MPNVKGSVLRSRLDFVEKQFGRYALDGVMAVLGAEQRQTLSRGLLPSQWYPFSLGEQLEQAILKTLGEDARQTFLEMGRRSADYNLTGVHQAFVHKGEPQRLLNRAPAIYNLYYDTGRRTCEEIGANQCRLVTHDSGIASELDCLTVIGWHQRAVELCDGRDVEVLHPLCRAQGDDVCEYLISWSLDSTTGDT